RRDRSRRGRSPAAMVRRGRGSARAARRRTPATYLVVRRNPLIAQNSNVSARGFNTRRVPSQQRESEPPVAICVGKFVRFGGQSNWGTISCPFRARDVPNVTWAPDDYLK